MARVKLSPLLSKLTGSVGPVTFQNSLGGIMLRQRPFPAGRVSQAQTLSRIHMSVVISAWQNLSVSQVNLWNKYAIYNPNCMKNFSKTPISGYSLFVKYNLIRLHTNLDLLLTPIFINDLDTYFFPELLWHTDELMWFASDKEVDPAERWLIVYLSRPVKNSINNISSQMRVVKLPVEASEDWLITSPYEASLHTTFVPGDIIFCSYIMFSTRTPIMQKSYPPQKLTVLQI